MSLRMQEMYMSADEDFSLPTVDSAKLVKSGPMLNDCFFGNRGYDPAQPFSKSQGEDLIINVVLKQRESTVPGWDSGWAANGGYSQPENYCTEIETEQWTDLKNVNPESEDWLEEWMDLNGIFDPSVEVPCLDLDIPACQTNQQNVVESESYLPRCMSDGSASPDVQEIEQTESGSDWECEQQELEFFSADEPEKPKAFTRGQKVVTREYVLRPISKSVELAMPPLPITANHVRSVKIIKASTLRAEEFSKNASKTSRSSPYRTMTERKREQNRSAAIRYREKRREEAKQKKEELHELELRNVALKTEVSGLTTEIGYLKKLLHDVIGR